MSNDSISSLSDLEPKTVNMVDGDFSCVNKKLLNVVSYNVNSLTHQGRVEELSAICRSIDADVICLQEIKIDESVSPSVYHIDGYSVEVRCRTTHGGGVATYIKNHIPYVRINNLESKTLEHISIDLIVNHKKYSVNNFYRPPNNLAQQRQEFLDEMDRTLLKLKSHRSGLTLILGDFNFGSTYAANMSLNPLPLDKKAPDLFLERGFYQQVDIPTRQVRLSSSLIDLIFADKVDNIVLTGTLPPLSDHCGTMISVNTLTFKPRPKTFQQYQYEEANWNKIKEAFNDLNNLDFQGNVEELAEQFSSKLVKIREDHVPSKTITINSKDKPWFNNQVRNKLTKSRRDFKAFKDANNKHKNTYADNATKTRLANDAVKKHDIYKKAKKEYETCARTAKKVYFQNLKQTLSNPGVSSKKKFQILGRVTNTGKNSFIPPLIDKGLVVHKPIEKANLFNDQFAKKATLDGYNDEAPELARLPVISELDGLLTSYYEIGPLIRALKTSEYSPCGIPSKFIQMSLERLGPTVSKPIAKLMNAAFDSGIFPRVFKVANITPIWKNKGSKTDKANFRPISILPTLSKLAESVLHSRLIGHLVTNNIITDYQAAYLKGDSTTLQLLNLTHRIRQAWAEDKIAHAAFLDVSAAFDAVWHNGLLAKLKQAGVSGSFHKLLESYLSDRIARTMVEGVPSSDTKITAGVPQGSRLGPILFILYINDLVQGLNCMPHIFADDTTLLAVGKTTHETVLCLNQDLQRISRWAKLWKVRFNGDKSKDLIFTPKKEQLNNSYPLIFDDEVLDRVGSHKHLGVTLEPDLSWDTHLKKVINHANLKMSILSSVRDLDRKTLAMMYKLLVRSIIDYCLPVYGPSLCKTQVAKLNKIQYRAARLAAQVPKCASASKLYQDLGWETIDARIKFLSLTLFQKIHTGATRPLTRACLPPKAVSETETRSGKTYLKYPYTDKVIAKTLKDSFFEKTTKQWENLPKDTKRTWDIEEFKQLLANTLKPGKIKIYNYGSKFRNSIHTQLRIGRSQLNEHLFKIGISEIQGCLCGNPNESTEHYLLDCFLYNKERQELFAYLKNTIGVMCKNFDSYSRDELVLTLLKGEDHQNYDRYPYNKLLFRAVQSFLTKTGRLRFKSVLQLT